MLEQKEVREFRDVFTRSGLEAGQIDPALIMVEPGHNPRDFTTQESLNHLLATKESIRLVGIRKPLLIRWEQSLRKAFLVDGETRLRAVRELNEESLAENKAPLILKVPFIKVQAQNEAERLLLALVGNAGKPLSQLEAASAYKRLLGFGWDKAQIASKCAVSLHHVTRSLELLDVPEEVRHQVASGAVTSAVAVKAVREHGPKAGPVLAEKIAGANGKVVKRERVTLVIKSPVSLAARKLLKEVTPADWEAQDEYVSVSYAALAELKTALEA